MRTGRWLSGVVSLLLAAGLLGCASMADHIPPPPSFLVKIDLNGPYDSDIPDKYRHQLQGASFAADWGIPYIFLSVGLHFESQGDETRALHFYDRAAEAFRQRQDALGEGTVLNRRIFALYAFGRSAEAYALIRKAEREWTNTPLRPFVHFNSGHLALMNGDYGQAVRFFRQAFQANARFRDSFHLLLLRRDTALESGIATILGGYVPVMSRMFEVLDVNAQALAAMRRNAPDGVALLKDTLTLNDEIRNTKIGAYTPPNVFDIMEANVYNFLALAEGIEGRFDKAADLFAQAAERSHKAAYRTGELDGLFLQNQVHLLAGDINAGRRSAEAFNNLADRYRFPFYQVWAKFMAARYSIGFGDMGKGADLLRRAIAVIEQQRGSLQTDVMKESYLVNLQVVYTALVNLLAREGDAAGALDVAERAKSRVLVDLLAGRNLGRSPAEKDLLAEEIRVSGQIGQWRRQLVRAPEGEAERDLQDRLSTAEGTHRGIVLKIREANEELASLVAVSNPKPSAFQAALCDKTTLLDYYVTEDRLYIWVITKARIHLERVSVKRDALRSLASAWVAALSNRDAKAAGDLGRNLADILLRPVLPFAVPGGRIGVVPHDILYYLPFGALMTERGYLVESWPLFALPSLGVLPYLPESASGQGWRLLALGNPALADRVLDLPYAAREVAALRTILPEATVLLGAEATRRRAMAGASSADILHFAAHGVYEPLAPLDSGLLLAPADGNDGRLSALDVFGLTFKGRLVTLSACKTALGASAVGTEIAGLNRSFLYAGSPRVLATLWNVDDAATADLMVSFYRHLRRSGETAESLRAAQVEMIRRGAGADLWAPFILTGRP